MQWRLACVVGFGGSFVGKEIGTRTATTGRNDGVCFGDCPRFQGIHVVEPVNERQGEYSKPQNNPKQGRRRTVMPWCAQVLRRWRSFHVAC